MTKLILMVRNLPFLFYGFVAGVFVLGLVYGAQVAATQHTDHASGAPGTVITDEAFEARYGVRVRLIGVTAAGGMIDLRLKVLDPEKAKQLLASHDGEHGTGLGLWVEDRQLLLTIPASAMHHASPELNRIMYLLFPNSHNAVRPGTRVAVVFGDVRSVARPAQ